MDAFYFVDKPLGISSFDIIRKLRKKYGIKKMGHTGTLDPLATGGMLIAIGNYTKLIPYLEKETKSYEFIVNLDGTTASSDLAEDIIFLEKSKQEYFKKELSISKIETVIKKFFIGKITQIPPKYSAIRINGKRAYELARKGVDIKMQGREVEVFEHEILDYNYPNIRLRAKVSAGTYIRTIASDLGKKLGTGGYISYLRRIKIGGLSIKNSVVLDNITEKDKYDVQKIWNKKKFLKNFDDHHLARLNDGLERFGKFDLEINKIYFIYNEGKITNIIKYDGEKIIPIKKVC